jgi:hypothetical protein
MASFPKYKNVYFNSLPLPGQEQASAWSGPADTAHKADPPVQPEVNMNLSHIRKH